MDISKAVNDVNPIENINKDYQSFQMKSHVEYEVLPLLKLLDYTYEQQNLLGLKEGNPSQVYCERQLGLCKFASLKARQVQIQANFYGIDVFLGVVQKTILAKP